MSKLLIDSKRELPVARAVKMGTSYRMIYSDHYTCMLTLTGLPRVRETKEKRQTVWNLAKEGAWNRYEALTEKYSQDLEKAMELENTIEDKMKVFERIHDKIKHKSFGKVTIGSKQLQYDKK